MGSANKITIDPGLAGTGYAVWTPHWQLIDHGVITSREEEWTSKGPDIVARLAERAMHFDAGVGYVELPQLFQSAGGLVTANSGALVKLAWFVGFICGRMPCPVELVGVNEWKGQLPKAIVQKRILKRMPGCRAKSHDWDAIGIGLYKAGRF